MPRVSCDIKLSNEKKASMKCILKIFIIFNFCILSNEVLRQEHVDSLTTNKNLWTFLEERIKGGNDLLTEKRF